MMFDLNDPCAARGLNQQYVNSPIPRAANVTNLNVLKIRTKDFGDKLLSLSGGKRLERESAVSKRQRKFGGNPCRKVFREGGKL
jgi:hypothetical protein